MSNTATKRLFLYCAVLVLPLIAGCPFSDQTIDPYGFNPVYYKSGVTDETKANGLYLGLGLDDDPLMIQYKVFHYKVPPGQAGKDPLIQPILLHQGIEEISDIDMRINVRNFVAAGETLPPGGWKILIKPD